MISRFEKKVADEYNSRFIRYGPQPKSSLWFSEQRQILRFDLMIDCIKKNSVPGYFSVNDIGCGYGGFLKRLQSNFSINSFSYAGFDLAKTPIEYCERNYSKEGAQFYSSGLPSKMADFSVMSGTFNFAPDLTVNACRNYLFSSLNSIWNLTRCSMIFNLMISNEDKITSQSISYIRQETILNFCQSNFGTTSKYFSSKLPREITLCISKI